MDAAKEFLAEEILVEKRVITYRYLSRAQKLHVNVAKKLLYDFHKSQNDRKPGSLHATYLLFGSKPVQAPSQTRAAESSGKDVEMEEQQVQQESVSVSFPIRSLTLVAEENLGEALSNYETIDAIHVYSVSSDPVKDLQLLADSARQIRELAAGKYVDDPSKVYGSIPNSHVRRRQRKGQAPGTASAAPKTTLPLGRPVTAASSVFNKTKAPEESETKAEANTEAKSAKAEPEKGPGPSSIWSKVAKAKEESKSATDSAAPSASATPASTDGKKAAPAKKAAQSGGGIMQAFAKGAAAAKPKKREPVASKAAAQTEEDTAMALSDDGGDDELELFPEAPAAKSGPSRKEREEELRKMMEDENEEEDDDDDKDDAPREDTPMEEPEEPAEEPASPKAEEPAEVQTETSQGRRRGKRRVTRKKMIEDENGYLVTIQEQGWESFSEDEPAPKPAPAKAAPAAAAPSVAGKAKKPAGQGSIMSFFAKK